MIYIDVLLIWWCSWWNKKLDLIWICFHLLYICIGKKIFCQIFEWEKKVSRKKKHSGLFIHECREILWLLPTPLYDITCSGFVGGARAPPAGLTPRIWGLSQGVKPDFCLSKLSYYSKHLWIWTAIYCADMISQISVFSLPNLSSYNSTSKYTQPCMAFSNTYGGNEL